MSCPAAVPGGNPPAIKCTRALCGLGMVAPSMIRTIAHPQAQRYRPEARAGNAWNPVSRRGFRPACELRLGCEILDFPTTLGVWIRGCCRLRVLKPAEKFRLDRSRLGALRVLAQQAYLTGVALNAGCAFDSSLTFQSV